MLFTEASACPCIHCAVTSDHSIIGFPTSKREGAQRLAHASAALEQNHGAVKLPGAYGQKSHK